MYSSINRITNQQVEDLVSILPIPEPKGGKPMPAFDAEEIANQYNQNLRFAPGIFNKAKAYIFIYFN